MALRVRSFIRLQAKEIPGVKIFRYEGALFFASFDYFRTKLIQKTGLDPLVLAKLHKRAAKSKQSADLSTVEETVIDCSNAADQLHGQNAYVSAIEHTYNQYGQVHSIENGAESQSGIIFESRSAYVRQNGASSASKETKSVDRDHSGLALDKMDNGFIMDRHPGPPNETNQTNENKTSTIHSIVLDCTGWSYIDVTALKALVEVLTLLNFIL